MAERIPTESTLPPHAPQAPGAADERPGPRALLGWTALHGLHLFPASIPLLPLIAPVRWIGDRLADRWPGALGVGAALHYALSLLCTLTLIRVVPFLAPSDVAWAAAAGALATLGSARRFGASPWWVVPLSFALPLALFPPMPPAWPTRWAIAAVSGIAMLALLVGMGRYARARASAVAWGFAVGVASVAFRIVLFWLLPTAQPATILEDLPGVRSIVLPAANPGLGFRGILPINHDDVRLVVEGCEADDRIVGSLHSLYLRRDGHWSRVGYPPGDRIEVDCARGVAWVPEMVEEKLWSVDLESLEVSKPFEHCEHAGPTLIRFNRERTALYGFPGGQHLGRYVPESGECRLAVTGGVIVSYAVDEGRGEALVARNGVLERCPLDGSQRCDRRVALEDPDLPAWLQRGLFNRPFFVVHFNKIVIDAPSNSILATSIQSGRLYRVDRDSFEIRESVMLERGIRWVQVDEARRRIYVGGFVRGTLYVLDADDLEVLAEHFIGRKIRYMESTADGRLLVAASTGAFEIDVDRWLEDEGTAAGREAPSRADPGVRMDELRSLPDGALYLPARNRG